LNFDAKKNLTLEFELRGNRKMRLGISNFEVKEKMQPWILNLATMEKCNFGFQASKKRKKG